MDFLDEKIFEKKVNAMIEALEICLLTYKVLDRMGIIDHESSDCEEES